MSRAEFHHKFYLLGTVTLAVAIPLSHFLMGLAPFLLLLNWLAEWNWNEKRARLRENQQGLWFAAFYFVYAIGLLHVTDWGAAGDEMLSKIPLLLSPIVVITSKPFDNKELRWIFGTFILATLFGCCWNFGYAQTHTLANFREMSRFIDHIRFSLCVALSIVFCLHLLSRLQGKNLVFQIIFLIISLLLLFYLIYSQTLSGIVILMVIAFCYIIHLIVNQKDKRIKWVFGGTLALFLTFLIGYITYITYDYFHVKDPSPDRTALTTSGNPYTFEEDPMVENGHYIGNYVCEKELQTAWAMRSDSVYDGQISATLIRYLNSLGLRKDSAAVMSLSDNDIRNIENLNANVYYTQKVSPRRALYETYFGFTLYGKYGIISESSLMERVELWRASWQVIREHWLFGVGIGNERAALDQQLEAQQSPIAGKRPGRGSHNQFLTYWMAGGIIPVLYLCFILVYPFAAMRKRVSFLYFAFITMMFLSMLVENTLDVQTGRMLWTTFLPILLFRPITNNQ